MTSLRPLPEIFLKFIAVQQESILRKKQKDKKLCSFPPFDNFKDINLKLVKSRDLLLIIYWYFFFLYSHALSRSQLLMTKDSRNYIDTTLTCVECHPTDMCIATGVANGEIVLWWAWIWRFNMNRQNRHVIITTATLRAFIPCKKRYQLTISRVRFSRGVLSRY